MAMKDVVEDLKIAKNHLLPHRNDPSVMTAMVHEDWLYQLLKDLSIPDKFICSDSDIKYALSQTIKLERPWTCLSIQVLSKKNGGIVSTFPKFHRPSTLQRDEDLDYSNLIHYITETNFKNLWKDVSKKYNRNVSHDRRHEKQKFNDAIREGLDRIYSCPFINSSSNNRRSYHCEHDTSDRGMVGGNILKAYCLVECERAFYLIQHHIGHTLYDCLTYSPAVFGSSLSKPLFVVYQLLQVMRDLHDKGMFAGDLSLNDVYLDQNLWVFVRPRIWDSLVREMKNNESTKNRAKRSATTVEAAQLNTTTDNCERLSNLVEDWVRCKISNFDYLMELNRLAGRRIGDPNHHPVLPWVMDFSSAHGGWRDLSKSKYRLTKGDKLLDLTYEAAAAKSDPDTPDCWSVAHHVSDVLTDITYYVYMARRTPRFTLCRHVRPKWVPAEYPSTIQRMQQWTPDECIPEFYTDPQVFISIHDDLPDLGIPSWAENVPDFIGKHRAALESDIVSERLHTWIDLTFGYRLSGVAAVKSKNVFLNLVDRHTHLSNCGINQIFTQPHPQRINLCAFKTPPKLKRKNDSKRRDGLTEEKENEVSDSVDSSLKTLTKQKSFKGSRSQCEQTIYLPKDYNPLAALNQLETTYNVTAKSTFQVPIGRETELNACTTYNNILHQRKMRDLVSLGCLIVELFLPGRFRLIGSQTDLEERYDLIVKILRVDSFELPRCVKSVVKLLLHISPETDLLFNRKIPLPVRHSTVTSLGLPPPSPHQLLQPLVKLFPFPAYIKEIYSFLSQIESNKSLAVNTKTERVLQDEVKAIERRLVRVMPRLSQEGIDIIIPYLQDMFVDERTDVLAAWCLFEPLAQALGPARTKKHFLTYLVPIYDRDTFTPKCLKLFHRTFLLRLLVRMGLRTFLSHFVTRLIEAVGGFKDYTAHEQGTRRKTSSHLHSPEIDALQDDAYETMLSPFADDDDNTDSKNRVDDDEKKMEKTDRVESTDTDYDPEPEMFLFDPVSDDLNDHSDERLTASSESGEDTSYELALDQSEARTPSNIRTSPSPVTESVRDDDDDDSFNETCTRSNNFLDLDVHYNVSDVATENVDWLSHRLGPVLTAKYLSRNLLRMLSLCYHGGEQLEFVPRRETDVSTDVSISNKRIAGDDNVANVLTCLSNIVVLYGEQFILVQYLSHIVDLVCCCKKRFTVNLEAGVIGSMMLLKHVIPFMSDAALMDNLQDVLIRDILYPTVQLISSSRLSFPNRALARRVIAFKLLDVLYLIGLRVGFEMTRKHLTQILQRFFSSFDRIYGTSNDTIKMNFPVAFEELKETFDSEMAYISYIPFCKLAGDIHMEKSLENDTLIRYLCTYYDKELLRVETDRDEGKIVNIPSAKSSISCVEEEQQIVSGTFGKNVAMVGNRIDIRVEDEKNSTTELILGAARDSAAKTESGRYNLFNTICKKMENNRRHLRGSWLAYWEHEIGQHEKDLEFNFKQIKLQSFTGHTASVRSIQSLDNEISFISGSKDKTVKLWSLRSHGDGSASSNCHWTYPCHKKGVFAVTFLESLRRVASCDGIVHIWDPFMGSLIKQMEPVKNSCVSVLASLPSPSSILVTAASDSNLRFFDVRSMKYIHEYKVSVAPAGLIRCVSVSPDGQWLCVGHSSGVISILDVRTGLISAIWKGHEGEILKIRAYNKNTFVTSSLDQHVSVWNADDGKLLNHLRGPTEPVHCFDFYRNEMVSASTANRIGVHTTIGDRASFSSTRLRTDAFRGMISALTILPLNRLVLLGADNGNISLLC